MIYWKRTTPSRKGQYWQLVTSFSYWSFVLKTHTSPSKSSSMNRLRDSHVFPSQAHCSQPLYGVLRTKCSKYCPTPPRFWCRFVDDTFVIYKEFNKQDFLQHISSVVPAIRFTVGDNKGDGSIPFLDTIVKPEDDGSLTITVYRKPTHTDQQLQWDSHHHLSAKFSVIHTLSHRAKTVCSKPELLQQEKDHLRKALTKCKYPKWALDKVEKRLNKSTRDDIDGANNQGTTVAQAVTSKVKTKGHIVIPHIQGLCESIKKICGRYGIQTHFKGGSTIKNIWSPPRTKNLWSTKVVPYIGTNVVT